MKKTTFQFILLSLFILSAHFNYSQNKIYFQEEHVDMPQNIDSFKWSTLPERSFYNDRYYGYVQFSETPNQQIQNEFKERGLKLTGYMGNSTYLFSFPSSTDISYLKSSGVVSVIPVPVRFKISSKIKNGGIGDWAREGDHILVNLRFYKGIPDNEVVTQLKTIPELLIREQYRGSNIITLSVPENVIYMIANLPVVKWIELIPEPDVKDDNRGRSIHRASNLDTQTLTGRNYTGEGIGVMVRDDGIVGPHIDFQGRIDNSLASGSGPTHGDGVAGIMAGAGNLDPTKRGMAAGSDVYVVNYVASFLDTPTTSLINDGTVNITNSSYTNGCNAGYTSTAVTADTQSNDLLSLLHVFSAGNSNGLNCGYGAGSQWGNITGGHKQGKNVIATANVYYYGELRHTSSIGPAYDGRIKPDITAHGQGQLSTDENNGYLTFGGTSGAAPGIAGVSAQLYQLYKDDNGGQLPEAALIKATLLNTANDYGNTGPDFKFGWGVVNGLRAAMLLEDQRYLDDNITQGNENNHTIHVPANTVQVRFMVYWNDPAATSGAATALVNDLDLKVTAPSNTEFLPWVLDHTPDETLLDLPATHGEDHLNNVEQVLINNPEAGDYTINISGFDIPMGPQHYFIVYEIITEELTLTYPVGGEKTVVGEEEVIHWDAINTTDDFVLEYSTDNGASWSTIETVAGMDTNYTWTVPNDVSGECLIRISSGAFTDQSDNTFSIANLVTGIDITKICPTELTVGWDALADASSYDVYLLGEKYMENVGTTTGTSLAVPITDLTGSFWVAVSASGGNGWESRRSIAIHYYSNGDLLNCTLENNMTLVALENDLSALDLICSGSNTVQISANVRNSGLNQQNNLTISYQLNTDAVVEEVLGDMAPGEQLTHTFTTPLEFTQNSENTFKIWVSATNDDFLIDNEIQETFFAQVIPENLNEIQTFEQGFPPAGWRISNTDNSETWSSTEVTGIDGQLTRVAWVDNYTYDTNGEEDIFTTLVYDLSGTNLTLNFDLAKAQYSSSLSDRLRVEISSDCGQDSQLFMKKKDLIYLLYLIMLPIDGSLITPVIGELKPLI